MRNILLAIIALLSSTTLFANINYETQSCSMNAYGSQSLKSFRTPSINLKLGDNPQALQIYCSGNMRGSEDVGTVTLYGTPQNGYIISDDNKTKVAVVNGSAHVTDPNINIDGIMATMNAQLTFTNNTAKIDAVITPNQPHQDFPSKIEMIDNRVAI